MNRSRTTSYSRPTYQQYCQSLTAYSQGLAEQTSAERLALAWGPSDYLLLHVRQLSKQRWQAAAGQLYQTISCKDLAEADAFTALWRQASMFDEKPFYDLPQLEAQKGAAKLLALIPSKQALPSPILLTYHADKLPAAIQQEASRLQATLIPCFPPLGRDLSTFLKDLCRDEGLAINDRGLTLLQDSLGNDLFKLAGELRKLALIFASQPTKTLGPDDLAPYLAVLREEHAFRLTELLLTRQHSQAHILSLDLLRRGESAIALLGILARHLRNTILLSAAASRPQAAPAVRLPYTVIKSYNQYVQRIRLTKASAALALCQHADLKLKSSRLHGDELLLLQVLEAIADMEV